MNGKNSHCRRHDANGQRQDRECPEILVTGRGLRYNRADVPAQKVEYKNCVGSERGCDDVLRTAEVLLARFFKTIMIYAHIQAKSHAVVLACILSAGAKHAQKLFR